MKVERIHTTPEFLYPERTAPVIESERKSTETAEALSFERQKRNPRERYPQEGKDKQHERLKQQNLAPKEEEAEIRHVDVVV